MATEIRVRWAERDTRDFMASIWAGDRRIIEGVLTTDHAASSQGQPVVVGPDGTAYGSAEVDELRVDFGGRDRLTESEMAMVRAAREIGYRIANVA